MSLKETKARASVLSGLRYRARFSGSLNSGTFDGTGTGCVTGLGGLLGEEKKERMPPLEGGGAASCCTALGGAGGGWVALIWATMCGSGRTFSASVNSSLLCSILFYHDVSNRKEK